MDKCECMKYEDKIKIIGALTREVERLKEITKSLENKGAVIKFEKEIIPEYNDLIERISNTPDCGS